MSARRSRRGRTFLVALAQSYGARGLPVEAVPGYSGLKYIAIGSDMWYANVMARTTRLENSVLVKGRKPGYQSASALLATIDYEAIEKRVLAYMPAGLGKSLYL